MKKLILLTFVFLFLGANSALAQESELKALNVTNAHIYTGEDNNQIQVNFDWFKDQAGGVRTNSLNLPRVDWRHSFDCKIPFRIGLNTALSAGSTEIGAGGGETSAFGFHDMGLTIEAGIVESEHFDMNFYVNQHFPFVDNNVFANNTLRPVSGVNAYGFQTGFLYQLGLGDHLTWYGDVAYRFDAPEASQLQHSLVYYNEAVLGLDSEDRFGLAIGLLGNSVYNNNVGTDLRLVPGVIWRMGDSAQIRAGFPIGLTSVSPDFGVQVSYFQTF